MSNCLWLESSRLWFCERSHKRRQGRYERMLQEAEKTLDGISKQRNECSNYEAMQFLARMV